MINIILDQYFRCADPETNNYCYDFELRFIIIILPTDGPEIVLPIARTKKIKLLLPYCLY